MKQKVAQRLMLVAIALLSLALVLCMREAVSADELWVNGEQVTDGTQYDEGDDVLVVFKYEGARIGYDPMAQSKDEVLEALDLVGPPPPPPDATNTDVWADPFQSGDYSDGGQSIADMNAAKFVSGIDWTGQTVWLFS